MIQKIYIYMRKVFTINIYVYFFPISFMIILNQDLFFSEVFLNISSTLGSLIALDED